MTEHSESQSESLNPDFLPDTTEYRGNDVERESIASQYLNYLNTLYYELINTESPRLFLSIAEDLTKLFAKLYKYFRNLPNSFIRSFQDIQLFTERDYKYQNKEDYRAFQKLKNLISRSGHIIEEIQRQSQLVEEQVVQDSVERQQRADNLDIMRIYRFFDITFEEYHEEEEEGQSLMNEEQSLEFMKYNPLFIFKNAEVLMRHSSSPKLRAHAALSYLRSVYYNMIDLLPTLYFAFRDIFTYHIEDYSFETQRYAGASFLSRLLDAGAYISQFCECNNSLMFALYQMSSEDARFRFACGFLRSFGLYHPFVSEFQEVPHGGYHFFGGVYEMDFEYFGRRFDSIYDEVAAKEPIDFIRELTELLPRTGGYARQNYETLMHGLRCYCLYGDLVEVEHFLQNFIIDYPDDNKRGLYNQDYSKAPDQEDAALKAAKVRAVNRKFAKRDAYYRQEAEIVEMKEQEAIYYDATTRLYCYVTLELAVKYAQRLQLYKAVEYLSLIGGDVSDKVGQSGHSILMQISAMRAAQIYAAQERTLTYFEKESIYKMLVDLQTGDSTSHIVFLKGLINADLDLLSIVDQQLQRPARVLTARLWFERNRGVLNRDDAALLELFGLSASDSELL